MINFVFDTNTLVSAALSPFSTNALAIKKAESIGKIVYCKATWAEFLNVLFRKKFDKYFSLETRNEIADRFLSRFTEIEITFGITDCRDPKDNIFLELALSSNAKCIISGDSDLLVLHPFKGIAILNAFDFVSSY